MSISTILPHFLFFGANAAVIAAAALAVVRIRQSPPPDRPPPPDRDDTFAASRISAHERQQLLINLRTERLLQGMQRQLDELAAEDRNVKRLLDRPIPVHDAIRMARRGATVEDLTRSCGLSVGEAQLMHKLHGTAALRAGALQ